jgi:hypothetical protein
VDEKKIIGRSSRLFFRQLTVGFVTDSTSCGLLACGGMIDTYTGLILENWPLLFGTDRSRVDYTAKTFSISLYRRTCSPASSAFSEIYAHSSSRSTTRHCHKKKKKEQDIFFLVIFTIQCFVNTSNPILVQML